MAHLIRICGGVSAAALAVALGFAFWPQFDRSLAGGRTPVEKPVFVVRATPVKLAAAVPPPAAAPTPVAAPAPAAPAAPPAASAAAATTTVVAPTAPAAPTQADPALTKLAMALRANGASQPADLGATRGLALASTGAPAASEEARRLCAQGLVALAQGSIASARAYLQRAAESGDARALLALGETYDPVTLARIGVLGLKGDAARARDYYAQALAAGLSIARERMAALNAP